MYFFPFVIPLVFFATVLLIVRWSLEHHKRRVRHRQDAESAGSSLGSSELKDLIREAVEEANEPLFDRVEALEARLDRLLEPRHTPLLDEALDAYDTEPTPAARRQRIT